MIGVNSRTVILILINNTFSSDLFNYRPHLLSFAAFQMSVATLFVKCHPSKQCLIGGKARSSLSRLTSCIRLFTAPDLSVVRTRTSTFSWWSRLRRTYVHGEIIILKKPEVERALGMTGTREG